MEKLAQGLGTTRDRGFLNLEYEYQKLPKYTYPQKANFYSHTKKAKCLLCWLLGTSSTHKLLVYGIFTLALRLRCLTMQRAEHECKAGMHSHHNTKQNCTHLLTWNQNSDKRLQWSFHNAAKLAPNISLSICLCKYSENTWKLKSRSVVYIINHEKKCDCVQISCL